MVRISFLYPNHDDVQFDKEYYLNNHKQLVEKELNRAGLVSAEFDIALDDSENITAPYIAVSHLLFSGYRSFHSAFELSGDKLASDVENFTNISPNVQISCIYK